MQKISTTILLIAAAASAVTIEDANIYMDNILAAHRNLINTTSSLTPFAPIPVFSFAVEKTSITNLRLTVTVTDGAIHGLNSMFQRLGDCQPLGLKDSRRVISCALDLTGINSTFFAHTRGDNILNTHKKVWVNVNLTDTIGQVEVVANPFEAGSLRIFNVSQLHFKASRDSILELNEQRDRQFIQHMKDKVQEELTAILNGEFKALLVRAVSIVPYPED